MLIDLYLTLGPAAVVIETVAAVLSLSGMISYWHGQQKEEITAHRD